MAEQNTFTNLLARVRAGDEQAAADLVRQYESFIRREVRLQLEDRRLCRLFDSMDICQSVLASFFVRTAAGEYDLENPQQLLKLLVTMARNKLASAARKQYQKRRDIRRRGDAEELDRAAAEAATPSQEVAGKELLEKFRARLTEEERAIAELRGQGLAWDEVAQQLGGAAQARRMQFSRGLERVSRELGLDDDSHA